jgi:xanthine dehydrogenase YagS FAD-binding subunit
MKAFEYARPSSLEQARSLLAEKPRSVLKAGGIDLIDHMKEHLLEPSRVVDLRAVPGLDRIEAASDGGLRIGPLATLADVAGHPDVRRTHAALAEACAEAASPQIRNVATIGGNLLQRPRCWYYRLESYHCLKKGGTLCYTVNGENRYHVIFGGGPCYAVHPSNAAVALLAFDAELVLEGAQGRRTVAAADFFVEPAEDSLRENRLGDGEILVEIRVPSAPGARSRYETARERAAFDWPLAAVAVVLRGGAEAVADPRIVLGAVAPVPWRVPRAEAAVAGQALTRAAADAAGEAATVGAAPLSDNGYKVALVRTLVRRALMALA